MQGIGWAILEELKWGDPAHPWVKPGHLFTQGPGTYKIPTVNDIPLDFRVSLLKVIPTLYIRAASNMDDLTSLHLVS